MTTPQDPYGTSRYQQHDARGRHAPARGGQQVTAWQAPPQPAVREQPGQRRPHLRLTGAEAFWYVLGCIAMGAMYFAKVPAKKALEEAGMAEMTTAERFWYVLMCIGFGAGYFAKLPVKKALTEARGSLLRRADKRAAAGHGEHQPLIDEDPDRALNRPERQP